MHEPGWLENLRMQARVHLEFCAQLYQDQIRAGMYFLHEHPAGAASWEEAPITAVAAHPSVGITTMHQCAYGACNKDGIPYRKSTKWVSNAPHLLQALGHKCTRDHKHVRLHGNDVKNAQVYGPGICHAILQGIRAQLLNDGILQPGCLGTLAPEEECKAEIWGEYYDVSGNALESRPIYSIPPPANYVESENATLK